MKISAFSFCRNAHTLFYPFVESIRSVLPVVHEFVIAVGKGDVGDRTVELIRAIGDDKIRLIHTEWDTKTFTGGTEYARQTDIAKAECTGDWLLYLQADEVIHEADLPTIHRRCSDLLSDSRVEGMVFNYLHFWGDYDHYHNSHGWYPREIRVVRNHPDIHSWVDAQSFRRIPEFDGVHFAQRDNTFKLTVANSRARIFHYGWVRPPDYMHRKKFLMDAMYRGEETPPPSEVFQYGNLSKLPVFKGTHPSVMSTRIASIDWKGALDYTGLQPVTRAPFKHEKPAYQALTWIEQRLLGGRHVGAFQNFTLIDV